MTKNDDWMNLCLKELDEVNNSDHGDDGDDGDVDGVLGDKNAIVRALSFANM